jgi:hypothetical protein
MGEMWKNEGIKAEIVEENDLEKFSKNVLNFEMVERQNGKEEAEGS